MYEQRREAKGSVMSDLIVIGYADAVAAERARDELFGLPPEDTERFSEAVIATRDKRGAIKLNHLVHLWTLKTGAGSIWGVLIGMIFLHPIFGVLAGAAAGAIVGGLTDYGVDEEFVKAVSDVLQPGRAALLLRRDISTRHEISEQVIERLASAGGQVLRTNLNTDMDHRLHQAFEEAHRCTRAGTAAH
jgi:uncharacterized membrane protein